MELLDVYDRDGRPTGRVIPRGEPLPAGEFYLCVHIWIRNSAGEFLIQRRSPDKELWPGLWAATGGCVQAGETSLHAAYRETQEELGLRLGSQPRPITRLTRENFFTDLWLAQAEADPAALTLQAEEVCDARWESASGILQMAARGEFVAYRYLQDLFQQAEFIE